MANTHLTFKYYAIVGHCDPYFVQQDENHYEGNGWKVEVLPNGTVKAVASRNYSDGKNTVILTVKRNGFARFVRITPDYAGGFRKETVWRRMVRNWNGCGTIILSGGNIRERYASVRMEAYEEFLREKGLTQVKFLNSWEELIDRTHRVEHSGAGDAWLHIYSDGKVVVNYDNETPADWMWTCERGRNTITGVTSASWVIIDEGMHLRDSHNAATTLYLLKGTDLFKAAIPAADQREAHLQ